MGGSNSAHEYMGGESTCFFFPETLKSIQLIPIGEKYCCNLCVLSEKMRGENLTFKSR